jgi:hypothetical protein
MLESPGNEPGPNIVTFTDRIENDEGAWQGSVVMLRSPDDTASGQMVMVGEGAYEGLTAIVAFESFTFSSASSCAVRGYIIDGSVPAPPVPQTGRSRRRVARALPANVALRLPARRSRRNEEHERRLFERRANPSLCQEVRSRTLGRVGSGSRDEASVEAYRSRWVRE